MEYKVIRNKNLKDFEKEVKEALNNGFTLYGNLVIDTAILPKLVVTIFHQVLIKKNKEKKSVVRQK